MKVSPEKVAALKWIDIALDSPEVQKLWGHLQKDIEQMKEHAMITGATPTTVQANLLRMCDLNPPTTAEEKVQTFLVFRSVVNYFTNKMNLLKANREIYRVGIEALQKQGDLVKEPQETLKSS